MPLVLKTLPTFLLAKTRNCYDPMHTSIPPYLQTHTHTLEVCMWYPPLGTPPAELPIPPPHRRPPPPPQLPRPPKS